MAKLSIIIPFGTNLQKTFIKERIEAKAREFISDKNIEYIFVEGYSSQVHNELESLIKKCGHLYLKDEKQIKQGRFSLAQCRNLGISFANSPVVMSLDVDYIITNESLRKILNLIENKGIDKNPNQFLILPCVFLNECGTILAQNKNFEAMQEIFKDDLISGKREFIKFFMKASSSIVMNRFKFLELGGYDDSFVGWGSEDFDFLTRLLISCAYFEKIPNELEYFAKNWEFNEFKGFRAWFSLASSESLYHSLFIFHLWHEEPFNQSKYYENRHKNAIKFNKTLKNYKNIFDGPCTLKDKSAKNVRFISFFTQNSNLYNSLRGIMPFVETFVDTKESYFFDENEKFDKKAFLEFYHQNNITHIFFQNSHASEQRLEIFKFAKEQGLKFIVYDRGALPDSWFFDDKGFNYDSSSYDENLWNKPLSKDQIIKTKEYIQDVLNNDNFLESQGIRNGATELRRKLGVKNKFIIFVPLQVAGDSVLKNFTYEPFLYENFLSIINELAINLAKQNIVFVAKKHPLSLSVDKKAYKNIKFAPDDTNLIDLIELCDMVLTLNSGVGVYAILANKPCVVCAGAFYRFDGLNLQAHNISDLKKHILSIFNNEFKFDAQKALRFIYYLRYEFYSFGKSYYKKSMENGRFFTRVFRIEFYQLILFGKKLLDFKSVHKKEFKLNSLMYQPFVYEISRGNFLEQKSENTLQVIKNSFSRRFLLRFKFFRLLKKLFTSPKLFIKDSKSPFIKPLKKLFQKER